MQKDYTLYGTKIYNHTKKEIGLLIYTWVNKYADGDVDFATCVDSKGKRYNTAMDNIQPLEAMDKEELQNLNLI